METTTEYTQSCIVNPDIPQTMPGIISLPFNMFEEIFAHLTIFDIANICMTNKFFYKLVNKHKWNIRSIILKDNFRNHHISYILARFCAPEIHFNSVAMNKMNDVFDIINYKTVIISDTNIYYFNDNISEQFYENLAKIEKLVLINVDIIAFVLKSLKNCKSIEFSRMNIRYPIISTLNQLKLDSICFNKCQFQDHDLISYLKIPKNFKII